MYIEKVWQVDNVSIKAGSQIETRSLNVSQVGNNLF